MDLVLNTLESSLISIVVSMRARFNYVAPSQFVTAHYHSKVTHKKAIESYPSPENES